jgi:glutathione S-transferase
MMKLLSSQASPFGRKVKIAAAMKNVLGDISIVATDTNVPSNDDLRKENPLGKIPVLILADGTQIYDSHVICEYLDTLKPTPTLFPASGAPRFKTLTLGALADGLIDAALLLVYEKRFRPEDKHVKAWTDRQQLKVDDTLAYLEKSPPAWSASPDYGHLTLACALGYLDFRHAGKWRAGRPRLVKWLDEFAAAVPAFAKTAPPPA